MWRILVVDDEPEIREVLGEYLRSIGHHVETIASGREALESVATANTPFDLALVDWHMPNITGRDVLAGIAQHSPDTRVLVITGHVGERVGKNHLAGLVARICNKPFALRDLKNELEELMVLQALGPAAAL